MPSLDLNPDLDLDASAAPETLPLERLGPWLSDPGDARRGRWTVRDGVGRLGALRRLVHPPSDSLRALARLHHPALPITLGLAEEPVPYWVTAPLPGRCLHEPGLRRAWDLDAALGVAAAVADALALMHRSGVAHGAVEGRNVWVAGSTVQLDVSALRDADVTVDPADDVRDLAALTLRLLPDALESGPEWLSTLLGEAMSDEPALRPSAARMADTIGRRIGPLPAPTVRALRVRARASHVEVPEVFAPVRRWVTDGGGLAVLGVPGSGRSRALDVAMQHAFVSGVPAVVLHPTPVPWASVVVALEDEGLPGLPEAMPEGPDRARRAAEALLRRADGRLRLIVDDVDELDPGTQAVVRAAFEGGAAVLVAGAAVPDWIRSVVRLAPWSEARARTLVAMILGPCDAEPCVSAVSRSGGCTPGAVVDLLCDALVRGAVTWRGRAFVVDEGAMSALPQAETGARWQVEGLDRDAAELGAMVAVDGPMRRSLARRLMASSETARTAARRLLAEGWVHGLHAIRCVSPAARHALIRGVGSPVDAYRAVVRFRGPVPSMARGAAVVGARDVDAIRSDGADCIVAAVAEDPAYAVQLAEQMSAMVSDARLCEARICAHMAAGQLERAREIGAAWLEEQSEPDVALLVRLAEVELSSNASGAAAMQWLTRAEAVLGDELPPASWRMAACRAHLSLGDGPAAMVALGPLASAAPDVDAPSQWLEVQELTAWAIAVTDTRAALAHVASIPSDLGPDCVARGALEAARAELCERLGRRNDAGEAWARAAKTPNLDPVRRAAWEARAALVWERAGRPQAAVDVLERALVERPDHPDLALAQARCFVHLGRWDAAERWAQVARARHPAGAEVVLAEVARGRGELERAAKTAESAEQCAARDGEDDLMVTAGWIRAEIGVERREADALGLVVHAHNAALRHDDATGSAIGDALRALLAARAGHHRSVQPFVSQALRTAGRVGTLPLMARVQLWVAEVRLALGQRDAARALAQSVHAETHSAGLAPLAFWARRLGTFTSPRDLDDRGRVQQLADCTLRLARIDGEAAALGELVTSAMDLCESERALVLRCAADGFVVAATAGAVSDPPLDVAERVREMGRPITVHLPLSVVVLAAPLRVYDRTWGVVMTCRQGASPSAATDHVVELGALADHASAALERAEASARREQGALRLREIAHDLQSPLAGIGALARGAILDGRGLSSDDATMIADAADHAAALAEQGVAMEPQVAFDWGTAVERWVRALDPIARSAGCELELEVDGGGSIWAGPHAIRRAVTNLIDNAIRHSPRGRPVRIRTRGERGWVELRVDDEGPGLPDGVTERLFESGVRGPGPDGGLGLGLAIVRRICREHGGEVIAEDRGHGSRFTVRLPRAPVGPA